jgi:hypothetical protein
MNVIDEIKKERIEFVPQEYKDSILQSIKKQLVLRDFAIVDGARHYKNQEWEFSTHKCKAPFKYHAAIATWLESIGFFTSRYYNNFGVDNGLKVRI